MGLRYEIWSISTYKALLGTLKNPSVALPFRFEMVRADTPQNLGVGGAG